jgi:hypothetical protein
MQAQKSGISEEAFPKEGEENNAAQQQSRLFLFLNLQKIRMFSLFPMATLSRYFCPA